MSTISRVSLFQHKNFFTNKHEFEVSQGSIDALFRWDGKHLQQSVANIFRTISTKFYHNQPGFVDDVTKTFGVFLGSQFQ